MSAHRQPARTSASLTGGCCSPIRANVDGVHTFSPDPVRVQQYTSGNHYCLVAVLDARDDPAPDVSTIQTWPDFVSLALNENNITWYNFDVLKLTPLVGDERFVSRP